LFVGDKIHVSRYSRKPKNKKEREADNPKSLIARDMKSGGKKIVLAGCVLRKGRLGRKATVLLPGWLCEECCDLK
jgi:hypothetical protein